jgi:GNAT superfamily N-acetyltransferase
VAVDASRVVESIVLMDIEEGFIVDNVAVCPTVTGNGIGRLRLQFAEAEARRRGHRQGGALPSSRVVLVVIDRPPSRVFDIFDASPTVLLQDGHV